MLAELMRLRWSIAIGGTHGKTTTTSLVAAVLEAARLDPTVINGGIIEAYGSNTRMGAGDWMVVEADESDGSFLRLPATIAVVTNMDPEHLDHWGSAESMTAGYDQFVGNIPFYGFAVLCIDHPAVQAMIPRMDRRIVTYGFSPQADIRGGNLRADKLGATFEVAVTDRFSGRGRRMGPFRLRMLGQHNVQNALAAVAVGFEMEIDDQTLKLRFRRFRGVKRRFTKTGEVGGITVIDDYGHHPVEIAAVLKAARQAGARDVVAIVQPHRYSRLASLFTEFCTCMNDAGTVIVADVYAAGEKPLEGIDRDGLVDGLRASGHRSVVPLANPTIWLRWCMPLRNPVISSCVWVRVTSRRGRTRCRHNWPRCRRRVVVRVVRHDGRARRGGHLDTLPPTAGRVQANAPLAQQTVVSRWWYGGNPVTTGKHVQICQAFLGTLPLDVPVTVIGAASNLIVRDGGIVPASSSVWHGASATSRWTSDGVVAGAAALDATVAEHAAQAGLTGLEFLSGIPGAIGGAVAMNAGAYGGDVVNTLDWAEIVTRQGELLRLAAGEIGFSLPPFRPAARMRCGSRTVSAPRRRPPPPLARAWRTYAASREATQPVSARTGGSTFRNPDGAKAWELIDAAGCRGLVRGGAQVSEKHCNFLFNTGTATAADLEGLGEEVRRRVHASSGITLVWEIKRIGVPGVRPEVVRMKRVAVLYGGISAEREVSLSSGLQVIAALRGAGLRCGAGRGRRRTLAAVIARSIRNPTLCSMLCMAVSARMASSRACWIGYGSPIRIPACAPPHWPWTRRPAALCWRPPACRSPPGASSRLRNWSGTIRCPVPMW